MARKLGVASLGSMAAGRLMVFVLTIFVCTKAEAGSTAEAISLDAPLCFVDTRSTCHDSQGLIVVKLLALSDYKAQCQKPEHQGQFQFYQSVLHLRWKRELAYSAVGDQIVRRMDFSLQRGGKGGISGSLRLGIGGFAYPPDLRLKPGQSRPAAEAQDIDLYAALADADAHGFRFWFERGAPEIDTDQCAMAAEMASTLGEKARQDLPPSLPELEGHIKQFDAVWQLARRVGACDDNQHRSDWDQFYLIYDTLMRKTPISAIARRQLSSEAGDYSVLAMNGANSKTLPLESADCVNVLRDASIFSSHLDALIKKGIWTPLNGQ